MAGQDFLSDHSTQRRIAAFWWFVFMGPVLITALTLAAGVMRDEKTALIAFYLGLWAFLLVVGLLVSPSSATLWQKMLVPLVVSVAGAAIAGTALIGIGKLSDLATATTTTSTAPSDSTATAP